MVVEAEVGRDIDTKQMNVSAGSADAVRSKPQYWTGTAHGGLDESEPGNSNSVLSALRFNRLADIQWLISSKQCTSREVDTAVSKRTEG